MGKLWVVTFYNKEIKKAIAKFPIGILAKYASYKIMKRLHNKPFIKKLMVDPKFKAEYDTLAPEFELLEKMLKARVTACL